MADFLRSWLATSGCYMGNQIRAALIYQHGRISGILAPHEYSKLFRPTDNRGRGSLSAKEGAQFLLYLSRQGRHYTIYGVWRIVIMKEALRRKLLQADSVPCDLAFIIMHFIRRYPSTVSSVPLTSHCHHSLSSTQLDSRHLRVAGSAGGFRNLTTPMPFYLHRVIEGRTTICCDDNFSSVIFALDFDISLKATFDMWMPSSCGFGSMSFLSDDEDDTDDQHINSILLRTKAESVRLLKHAPG